MNICSESHLDVYIALSKPGIKRYSEWLTHRWTAKSLVTKTTFGDGPQLLHFLGVHPTV